MLDVNDNSPVFRSPRYARKMSEGVSVGTIVLVVQADDADIGSNGDIRYDITTGNDAGTTKLVRDGIFYCGGEVVGCRRMNCLHFVCNHRFSPQLSFFSMILYCSELFWFS